MHTASNDDLIALHANYSGAKEEKHRTSNIFTWVTSCLSAVKSTKLHRFWFADYRVEYRSAALGELGQSDKRLRRVYLCSTATRNEMNLLLYHLCMMMTNHTSLAASAFFTTFKNVLSPLSKRSNLLKCLLNQASTDCMFDFSASAYSATWTSPDHANYQHYRSMLVAAMLTNSPSDKRADLRSNGHNKASRQAFLWIGGQLPNKEAKMLPRHITLQHG